MTAATTKADEAMGRLMTPTTGPQHREKTKLQTYEMNNIAKYPGTSPNTEA
jgi:hypothetical protein